MLTIVHIIQDNVELADVQKAGIGFIANARYDGMNLHCAGCRAVGLVASAVFPKYHFETYAEAARWFDKKNTWSLCDICSPTND